MENNRSESEILDDVLFVLRSNSGTSRALIDIIDTAVWSVERQGYDRQTVLAKSHTKKERILNLVKR